MLRKLTVRATVIAVLIFCAAAAVPALAQGGEVSTWIWDFSAFIDPCATPCHFDGLLVGPGAGTVVDARLIVDFRTVADFTGEPEPRWRRICPGLGTTLPVALVVTNIALDSRESVPQ